MNKEPLLKVENLSVTFFTPRGTVTAVREASFEISRGEVLGIVGESGCGKSTTAFAVMGYLPTTAETTFSSTMPPSAHVRKASSGRARWSCSRR